MISVKQGSSLIRQTRPAGPHGPPDTDLQRKTRGPETARPSAGRAAGASSGRLRFLQPDSGQCASGAQIFSPAWVKGTFFDMLSVMRIGVIASMQRAASAGPAS